MIGFAGPFLSNVQINSVFVSPRLFCRILGHFHFLPF